MNFASVQFDADASSLKLYKEGSGIIHTPYTWDTTGTFVLAHGYPTDNLIYQVTIRDGSIGYTTPFESPNGNLFMKAYLDPTNFHIHIRTVGGGEPFPAKDWAYTYRLLIP